MPVPAGYSVMSTTDIYHATIVNVVGSLDSGWTVNALLWSITAPSDK